MDSAEKIEISVYLDRIEELEDGGAEAVLLIDEGGEDYSGEFGLPTNFLPEGASDGDYLSFKISRVENPRDETAQTSANISVDETAETSAKISVDGTAQTGAKIPADETAETSAKISVDETAQTSANISVDDTAQTSANISVDGTAQTSANISVDGTAETSAKILRRTAANLFSQRISCRKTPAPVKFSQSKLPATKIKLTPRSTRRANF